MLVAGALECIQLLGVTDNPPVQQVKWTLDVEADADAEQLDALKRASDEHCPGVWCLRNPVELETTLIA